MKIDIGIPEAERREISAKLGNPLIRRTPVDEKNAWMLQSMLARD